MHWNTIRLELARTSEFPAGSVGRGYLIRVPLNDYGSIDAAMLVQDPRKATVRRFWSSDPDLSGYVVRVDEHWVLRLDGRPDYLLPLKSRLKIGKKIEVTGSDGVALPFQVADVRRFG